MLVGGPSSIEVNQDGCAVGAGVVGVMVGRLVGMLLRKVLTFHEALQEIAENDCV
jgi:hypothetical protein